MSGVDGAPCMERGPARACPAGVSTPQNLPHDRARRRSSSSVCEQQRHTRPFGRFARVLSRERGQVEARGSPAVALQAQPRHRVRTPPCTSSTRRQRAQPSIAEDMSLRGAFRTSSLRCEIVRAYAPSSVRTVEPRNVYGVAWTCQIQGGRGTTDAPRRHATNRNPLWFQEEILRVSTRRYDCGAHERSQHLLRHSTRSGCSFETEGGAEPVTLDRGPHVRIEVLGIVGDPHVIVGQGLPNLSVMGADLVAAGLRPPGFTHRLGRRIARGGRNVTPALQRSSHGACLFHLQLPR